jgi:hypothetical protein
LAAPDGAPRASALADSRRGEREVALELRARGGEVLMTDKSRAGREFAASAAERSFLEVGSKRADEAGNGPHPA